MAYSKTTWVDRVVQYPNRYTDQNSNVYTFTQSAGTVTSAGTPVNASNLNKIENEVALLDSATLFESATGSANSILVTTPTLVDGFQKNFVALYNNNGAVTTINSIPVYKPNTTTAPTLIAGQAYVARYNLSANAYYIESYAEKVHTHTLSEFGITTTATKINYVNGLTSDAQTQIDTKAPKASPTFTGTVNISGNGVVASNTNYGTSQIRNAYITNVDLTEGTSEMNNGEICLVYRES